MRSQILLSFLYFAVTFCHAQTIKFEHYNDEDGLSHNSVRHITQDSKGFLWFGTFYGLNRFDGYQFKTFLSSESGKNKLHNDDITALELDEESNNFWIGTRKGLSLYKLNTQVITTYFPEPNNSNSLLDEEIRAVHVDKFKRVWVGTKEKGVSLFYPDEERFEKIPLDGFDYVKEIYEDKNGAIWIGSFETAAVAKLTLDDSGKIVKIKKYTLSIPNSTEKNPYLNFIYEDAKSDIFIGTREGLYTLNTTTDEFENLYIEDKEIRSSLGPHFLSVAQAPDGKYWLGTLGGLLVCDKLEDLRTGNYKWYYSILSDNRSLVDNLVYALYFDASGVLWIGTEDGLDKYDPYENQFVLNKDISKYIGNQAPRIRGFAKTYDGELIAQTRNNGLFISDDDNFVPLYDNKKDIASIYSEDGRIFYCGLWNGNLMIYDYSKNESKEISTGFESFPVFAFCKIDEQSMIIGSFGDGAILFNTQTLQVIDAKNKLLPNYQIVAIENDGVGNAWFATETGVVKYHITSSKIETFDPIPKTQIGLPENNNVSDILIDSKGKIWASTPNGLSYYDSAINNFKILTEPKEVYRKWITDILTDAAGNLWLNMNNNSVARLKANLKDVTVYHVNSGNRLDFFSSSGFYEFNNSNIYLGGKNGIIHFSSQTMAKNEWSPIPVITEFKIQNEDVFPGRSINGQVPLLKDI
ncbi:MAG TPA: hybrid sensor histidine kinase/response regulator, partial [Pricia sp.]|nr:hybrid sensor histidine kinase/response regulator [Pricia sp.]